MHELFPVLAGVVVAVALRRLRPRRLRLAAAALLIVGCGIAASAVSGELAVSWGFVLLDVAQVAVAAAVTTVLVGRGLAVPRHLGRHGGGRAA